MTVDKLAPEAFQGVQAHLALERLMARIYESNQKRQSLLFNNKWHFKQIDVAEGLHTNRYLETPSDPAPLDDEGKIIKRLLVDYDQSIKQMEAEVQRLTSELLEPPKLQEPNATVLSQVISPITFTFSFEQG